MSAQPRLILALSISGLVLGVLAGPCWGHPWWAAALAPAPLLVALRCLPLAPGIALALGIGLGARLLGALLVPQAGAVAAAALGAVALLPALLADRSCVFRWPYWGSYCFPLLVLITAAAARAAGLSIEPLPVAPDAALDAALAGLCGGWVAPLSWAVWPVVCAMLAQALAGLAAVDNWHRPDPISQEQREGGARTAAVVAGLVLLAVLLGAALL